MELVKGQNWKKYCEREKSMYQHICIYSMLEYNPAMCIVEFGLAWHQKEQIKIFFIQKIVGGELKEEAALGSEERQEKKLTLYSADLTDLIL